MLHTRETLEQVNTGKDKSDSVVEESVLVLECQQFHVIPFTVQIEMW